MASLSSEENNPDGSRFINGDDCFRYLIVRPECGGFHEFLKYLVMADVESGVRFLEGSDHGVSRREAAEFRWIILVSIVVRKFIAVFRKPMEVIGCAVDFFLNLLADNGNIFGLFFNILSANVVIPKRGTKTFISTIGQIDRRIDLLIVGDLVRSTDESRSLKVELGSREMMDLCMMASKLAYENAQVVQDVVNLHWKMHFVDFCNCWNDYQKQMSTQVFILCDKPKDANLILISFRGTEPFDADDWITDWDYSWYEIPNMGKVHMGFIEALGLGRRTDISTFKNHLKQTKTVNSKNDKVVSPSDGDKEAHVCAFNEKSAHYVVRHKLKSLLDEHKNAKFIVTGHSLGGALAILFPSVLVLNDETDVMERLLGVYTFGQPRIGNRELGRFMEAHLGNPVPKYFRMVYCNDLVTRLPYDNTTFLYKHFGVCIYYNSFYNEQKVDEAPNRNYFGPWYMILAYLNAVWELIRSLMMGYIYGPEYKEGWFTLVVRLMGLALPGVSAHSPTDYINSIRLGRERSIHMSSF